MKKDTIIPNPSLWLVMLSAAMAGGMGWGIRGQYGHETGAMIAGLLVSLVLVFLFCPGNSSIHVVRAAALGTIAMGFGGSMTYGQTIGLTHDNPLIGNWEALRWGMLGLAIKGSIWIGFAGLFLGIGLGGKRYQPHEMFLLILTMLVAVVIGWWVLNTPHDPENKQLPFLYFSDHWKWEPDATLKHRPEIWGGLLFGLFSGIVYANFKKNDQLACNLALWGMLGGAIGFPLGQVIQATNGWNPDFFRESFLGGLTKYFNWWNMMETTFGAVMGAILGLGLWINRRRIAVSNETDVSPLPNWLVGILLITHLSLLVLVEFSKIDWIDGVYDLGLMMALIPLVLCVRGRWGPYLQLLPITLIPIAGKTLRALVDPVNQSLYWLSYLILPILIATTIAIWFARQAKPNGEHPLFIRSALLFSIWIYHGLNFAFFNFPWPWEAWGGRTPNAMIFLICMLGLSALALFYNPIERRWGFNMWRCEID